MTHHPNDAAAGAAFRSQLQALGLITVVIPAFNEEAALGGDLDAIASAMDAAGACYEIVVVDDGSTDRTADIVRARPRVRLVRHPVNRGVGAARTTGMRSARGDVIITTDGDGTYPNHEMPRLLAALSDHDMVIGARVREAGTLPWLRIPAKWIIRRLASYLTGAAIPDLNSGLRCYRRSVAEQFTPLLPNGHSWESTITIAYLSSGYRVRWLPVEYYARRGGRSSFHPVGDTASYLRLVGRTVFLFHPQRMLTPPALALTALGGLAAIRERRTDGNLARGLAICGAVLGIAGVIAEMAVRRKKRATPRVSGVVAGDG
ncbi:MAG: glycosyltransferase family 2 protein [Chloroflexi bacterium]|nr:glycosyltransferase family 2 protein [Chloroflexota bacterium]